MKPRSDWRKWLPSSIEGQLQLATGGVVATGFTIASIATVWISNQNLLRQLQEQSASVNRAISKEAKPSLELPILERDRKLLQAREEQTNWQHTVWLEFDDGSHLLPSRSEGSVPPDVIWQLAGRSHPEGVGKPVYTHLSDGTTILSMVSQSEIPGIQIGIAQNITAFTSALYHQYLLLVLTWGGALLLSLHLTSSLVRRIVRPLRQLSQAASTVTSDSLPQGQIVIQASPSEVTDLAAAYNGLIDRLAQAWQQQESFVSSVSHELRTPLTIVSGYLQRTLRRSKSLQVEDRKNLTIAEEEAQRITRLLGNLLSLSRNDCQQLSLSLEVIDPLPLLEEVVALSRHALSRPFVLDQEALSAERFCKILASPDQLKQVIINLIENADKYSAAGQPIEIHLRADGDEFIIAVCDHGDGIAPADLPHIFERFYRGTTSRRSPGSGLGLSIVQLFIEAMGGQIQVSSTPGQGSCFELHLARVMKR
jgi:signal transduction histidine kinase